MHRSLQIRFLVVGFACLAAGASAQNQPETTSQPKPPPSVDNKVDVRPAADESRFKSLDTNGDARISRSEFAISPIPAFDGTDMTPTAAKPEKKHWWNRTANDRNDNSKDLFDQLDANNDGYLSRAELAGQGEKSKK